MPSIISWFIIIICLIVLLWFLFHFWKKEKEEQERDDNKSYLKAVKSCNTTLLNKEETNKSLQGNLLVMYLQTAINHSFLGHELLQALLSVGMRFGEMNLFHRYEEVTGKGQILFSLASASSPWVFDLRKMTSFSARGLCLYMYLSGDLVFDSERFSLLLKTSQQLAKALNADCLDDKKKPLTQMSIDNYNAIILKENKIKTAKEPG